MWFWLRVCNFQFGCFCQRETFAQQYLFASSSSVKWITQFITRFLCLGRSICWLLPARSCVPFVGGHSEHPGNMQSNTSHGPQPSPPTHTNKVFSNSNFFSNCAVSRKVCRHRGKARRWGSPLHDSHCKLGPGAWVSRSDMHRGEMYDYVRARGMPGQASARRVAHGCECPNSPTGAIRLLKHTETVICPITELAGHPSPVGWRM